MSRSNILSCAAVLAVIAGCASPRSKTGDAADAKSTHSQQVAQSSPIQAVHVDEGDYYGWMPLPVTSFGAAALDSSVCIVGGYSGKPHAYSREGQSNQFECYDFSRSQWVGKSPLPHRAQGVVLVSHKGALLRVGGMQATNERRQDMALYSMEDVASYDPLSNTWTELPPLPEARSSHAACVSGDTLFVVGGWTLAGDAKSAQWATTSWAADLSAKRVDWTAIEMPFRARAGGVACTSKGFVYVGGIGPQGKRAETFVFDKESRSWSQGPDYPGDGFGVAALGIRRGAIASGADGAVYRLRHRGDQWEKVSSLLFPRFFHQLVMMKGERLIAIGGIQSMRSGKRIGHIEQVPLPGLPLVTVLELPNKSAAKNRQGALLTEDSLYLFGGNNSVGQHDFEPENFLTEAVALDVASLSWTELPPFPKNRQTMSVETRDDSGFVVVGGFGAGGKGPQTFSEAYVFDKAKQKWSSDPASLPAGRSQFGLAFHDGWLWAFGGLNYDSSRPGALAFDHRTDILVAKPGEPFKDSGARLRSGRRAFGGAAMGEHYYMVGGMKENFQLVQDCTAFDFHSRKFSPMPCPATTRLSPELVAIEGRLFLVGGSVLIDGKAVPAQTIEVYDPETRVWSTWVEDVPITGTHMRAFAYRDRLLLYSAHEPDRQVVRLGFVSVN